MAGKADDNFIKWLFFKHRCIISMAIDNLSKQANQADY